MKKTSKVILMIGIVLIGLILVQQQVQASDQIVLSTNATPAGNSAGNVAGNVPDNNAIPSNAPVNNTPVNNVVNNAVNKSVTNNNTNTLPKAGIEDSPVGIIMIIGAVSAIYAYKKIRDYNV